MRKLASIQKVVSVEPIKDADKIEKITVLGWELVAKKGETGSLTLNFKNGALENKSQANLINK